MLFINLNPRCWEQGDTVTGTLNSQVQFGKYNVISDAHMPPHALTLFPYNNSEVIFTMGVRSA